jgi:hypothetical protein
MSHWEQWPPAAEREGKASVSFFSSGESQVLLLHRFVPFVYGFLHALLSSITHEAGGGRIVYAYGPVLSFVLADPDRLFCFPCNGLSIWKDLPVGKLSVRFAQRWLPHIELRLSSLWALEVFF